MKNLISSLVITILFVSSLQSCTKRDSLTVYPTTDEQLTWNLREVFFNYPAVKYSLSDTTQTDFSIIEPIENTGGQENYSNTVTKIVSARALISNGKWINSFVFLNQDTTGVTIGVAVGETGQSLLAPQFNEFITVDTIANLKCFDLEILTSTTYIVDCQIITGTTTQNILYYINGEDSFAQLTEDSLVESPKGRVLGQYTVTGQLTSYTYLIRLTPAYQNDNSLIGDSLLEVYILDQNGKPTNTGYILDGLTMALLLGEEYDFEFNIVDMKVLPNGDIYLLDAQYGIYIINFIPNGTFKIKNQIDTGMNFAYAFDRNLFIRSDGTYTENIAILGYQYVALLVDGNYAAQYSLPATVQDYSFPNNIDLSQEFIIVRQNDNTYLFDIDSDSTDLLFYETVQSTNYILINPYYPDIVVLTQTQASRYTLSQGQLKYNGYTDPSEQKTLVISVTDLPTCFVTINYTIIQSSDKQLYPYGDVTTPFPTSITEDSEPFQLSTLTSGPNEQYKQSVSDDDTSVSVSFNTFWNLGFQTALPTNLVFVDVLIGQDPTYFFIAQQKKDYTLTVIKVTHPSIYSDTTTQETIFENYSVGGVTLNSKTFLMFECECPKFHFAYVSGGNVEIRVVNSGQVKTVNSVSFTNGIAILYLYNYLAFLSEGVLSAYSIHGDFLSTVDVTALQSQGYTGVWNPLNIFGNRKIKQNFIFVVHENHITILDYHNKFTFIEQIAIVDSNVQIAVAQETFFIVGVNSIVEYNYDRLNNIAKTKTVQLYDYELVDPLFADFSSDTGYLFVVTTLANSNDDQTYYLLAIQPNTFQHDTLFKAIEIDGVPNLLATQGTQQEMFIYVQTANGGNVYSLLTQAVILIEPSIVNPEFSTDVTLSFELYNYDDTTPISIAQLVKVINTQTKISVDKTKFTNKVEIADDSTVTTFSLNNTWYTGQITEFKITCQQCGNGIEISQLVNPTEQSVWQEYLIRSINNNLVQAKSELFFVNLDDSLSDTVIDLDFETEEYECYQATQNDLYILSLCNDGTQFTVYATSGLSLTGWSPVGEVLQLGQDVQKIELLENDILVILTSTQLSINQLDTTQDEWVLTSIITVDLTYIQVSFETITSFTPQDFLVLTLDTYYKIFITSGQGLFVINYSTDLELLELIDLNSELQNLKYYATNSTTYLSIQQINYADNVLKVFIQTSNVVHYGLAITLQNGENCLIYKSLDILYMLNRYGTWPTLKRVAISDSYVAVPYYQDTTVLVTVYNIDGATSKIPLTIIGSYVWQTEETIDPLTFSFYIRNGKLYGNNPQSTMLLYQLNSQPVLTFTNSKTNLLKSQEITITPSNDFYSNSVILELNVTSTVPPGPGPDPDPDNPDEGSKVWWIILIVVAGVLLLGGVGFVVYRMKNKNKKLDDYNSSINYQ